MSPNDYASLEFSAVPCKNGSSSAAFAPCTNANALTFTKNQQDYGAHQSMSLNGRNNNGIYEPKVMNGLGYTVQAQYEMPPSVSITYTDAPVAPFKIQLGICYQTDQGPPQCPGGDCSTVFKVSKGVKALGSPGSTSLSALNPYWQYFNVCYALDNTYSYSSGFFNFPNLSFCPDPTVVAVPGAIVPPTMPVQLTQVQSIADLTPTTYAYDQNTGLLFVNVQQTNVNGSATYSPLGGGPSPLGSCDGASPDAACPDFAHGESFYSCPSGGCELYMVEVINSTTYPYDPTKVGGTCAPYPTYAQQYPSSLNFLKDVATSTVLTPSNLKVCGLLPGEFPHLVESSATCP